MDTNDTVNDNTPTKEQENVDSMGNTKGKTKKKKVIKKIISK